MQPTRSCVGLKLNNCALILPSLWSEVQGRKWKNNGACMMVFDLEMNKKIRHRSKHGVNCYGHYMPRMMVHAKNHTPIEIKLHFY